MHLDPCVDCYCVHAAGVGHHMKQALYNGLTTGSVELGSEAVCTLTGQLAEAHTHHAVRALGERRACLGHGFACKHTLQINLL
jgi:hypothetical protein